MNNTDFQIDREAYADVLDLSLSDMDDPITVDRRGYAPIVAEAYGTAYLDDKILLGGREQAEEQLIHEPYSTLVELVDAVYDTDLPDHASPEDPVVLQVHVEYDADESVFVFDTEAQYNDELEALNAVEDVVTAVNELDENGLDDNTSIDDLTSQAANLRDRFGELTQVDTTVVSDAQTTSRSFTFSDGQDTGYMFASSPPIVVRESDTSLQVPYNHEAVEYDLVQDGNHVLEALYDNNYVYINNGSVRDRISDIGTSVLEEELTGVAFFRAMNEADTPDTYDALHELLVKTDITLRSEADQSKLDYLEPKDDTTQHLLDTMMDRYDEIALRNQTETENSRDQACNDDDDGGDSDIDIADWILPQNPLNQQSYTGQESERIQEHLNRSRNPNRYR